MIRILIVLVLLSSLVSCMNYETEKYFDHENLAINDIIPQMIKYHEMVKMNNFDILNLKLYLISTLDTQICKTYKPEGFVVSVNGDKLPDKEIKEIQKEYEDELDKYELEMKLFSALRKGILKKEFLTIDLSIQP